MIARRVDSVAHAVAEDTEKDLGKDGEHLVRYVRWLRDRIAALGGPDYRPVIHLDVRGALGHIYDNNLGRILGYLYRLESSVQPYALRLQDPVTMESRAAQIDTMRTLRKYIRFREMSVEIVVDQWANSPDDVQAFAAAEAADMIYIRMPELGSVGNAAETVLACKQSGDGAVLGGSSTETDLAARVAAHVALATQPDLVLARPGIDVDTAVSTTRNEMARALVLIEAHSQ
jgi:methylaspartate ammonia-lyase